MDSDGERGVQAFRDFEVAGWNRSAPNYADAFGRSTALFIPALLDAAGIEAGTRVLDLACGPGDLTGAAAARGADVTGADISEGMVAQAQARHPGIAFARAPAEELPFGEASFDLVACNFGLHHFGKPARAAAEIYRMLVPQGRLVFTAWHGNTVAQLGRSAVERHGNPGVKRDASAHFQTMPASDWRATVLPEAGFAETSFHEVEVELALERAEQVLDLLNTSVMLRAAVEAQDDNVRQRVYDEMVTGARAYERDSVIRLPMSAALVVARRG